MHIFLKTLGALALAALALSPAFAGSASSPIGKWQVTTGEARYTIAACGTGKTQLCAKLVWLRADQRNAKNLAALNSYLVKGAVASAANEWRGNVVFAGQSYDGTLTLVSKNYMKLRGCSGFLCQTYEFTRI